MATSELDEIWLRTDDGLYAALGAALLGAGSGMSSDEPERFRRFGREWFTRRLPDLRRRICGHPRVRALGESSPAERVLGAATIYQILCQVDEYTANALVLAVLVARVGIGTFCAGDAAAS